MKKYEEAKLEVVLVANAVIVTSGGCKGAKQSECDAVVQEHVYDSEANSLTCNSYQLW